MRPSGSNRSIVLRIPVLGVAVLLAAAAAGGAKPIDTGTNLTVNWDNTITLSAAHQTYGGGAGGSFYASGSGTAGVYDRGGFTPLRGDLLTEIDIDRAGFGLRASAAGRYEEIETATGSGHSYRACNRTVAASGSCTYGHGEIELFDAFAHGSTTLFKDQRLSFRIGRHTLLWGESVYFANNGIAAGQAPIDTSMIETGALYESRNTFLPVGQASLSWQPTNDIAVDLYYQFEWRHSRLGIPEKIIPASDIPSGSLPPGGPAPLYFSQTGRETPNSTDQYGAALKWHHGEADYGLYALSFDAKAPVLHFDPAGTFSEEFPKGIEIFGTSLAGPLGPASFGAEISARRNMPLVTGGVIDSPGGSTGVQRAPVGDTLHGQFSWTYVTPPLPWVPGGADWTSEIAANGLLKTSAKPAQLTLDRTKYAGAFRTVFELRFFQVIPRVDLTVPIGLGYNLFGLSPVDPTMNRGTGDVSVGVTATLDQVWKGALTATHYIGTAKNVFPYNFVTPGRRLDEADFIRLTLQRTF